MAIGNRTLLTPEWAFWHRQSVLGSMMCRIEVSATRSMKDTEWKPEDGFGTAKQVDETLIYVGPARVQPNKDWRARKQKYETELVTEHAYRIQLPFEGNELTDTSGNKKPFPVIEVEDRVRVTTVMTLRGVPVDPDIAKHTYVVRNTVTGSNYWVRTLLCDVLV